MNSGMSKKGFGSFLVAIIIVGLVFVLYLFSDKLEWFSITAENELVYETLDLNVGDGFESEDITKVTKTMDNGYIVLMGTANRVLKYSETGTLEWELDLPQVTVFGIYENYYFDVVQKDENNYVIIGDISYEDMKPDYMLLTIESNELGNLFVYDVKREELYDNYDKCDVVYQYTEGLDLDNVFLMEGVYVTPEFIKVSESDFFFGNAKFIEDEIFTLSSNFELFKVSNDYKTIALAEETISDVGNMTTNYYQTIFMDANNIITAYADLTVCDELCTSRIEDNKIRSRKINGEENWSIDLAADENKCEYVLSLVQSDEDEFLLECVVDFEENNSLRLIKFNNTGDVLGSRIVNTDNAEYFPMLGMVEDEVILYTLTPSGSAISVVDTDRKEYSLNEARLEDEDKILSINIIDNKIIVIKN